MQYEEGQIITCPNCEGTKIMNNKKPCTACKGDGKMEVTYTAYHGAPAGTWFPTKRRGKSGWLIVLFGPAKQEMTR